MAHTIRDQKRLLSRIRRINGQGEALERALRDGTRCDAILQQIAAMRGAVNGLMVEVLEGHLRDHLAAETSARKRHHDLEHIVRVVKSYMK